MADGTRSAVTVVGGRGFLGRAITAELEAAGHDVHVLERDNPALTPAGLAPEVVAAGTVVWAASSINPMISANDPERVEADLDTFGGFVDAVAALERPARILLLSSGGTVYDENAEPPYTESSPTVPASDYGRAKLALEHRLADAPETLVLRVANAYGPGQPLAPGQGVIAHWMSAFLAGHTPHLYGDPERARDYVYVADIAAAVRAAVETDRWTERILNIGSGVPTPLGRLYELVRAAAGADGVEPHRHPGRDYDVRSTWLNCERAAATIGWRARTPLEDGLAAAWRHLVATTPAGPPPETSR